MAAIQAPSLCQPVPPAVLLPASRPQLSKGHIPSLRASPRPTSCRNSWGACWVLLILGPLPAPLNQSPHGFEPSKVESAAPRTKT